MNTLTFTILQAAAAEAPAQGGGATMWIMLILIFVIMYIFMIRPQQKQQKELREFRSSLKKGDKIVTAGGIYGTVVELKDDGKKIIILVDDGVKLKMDINSIVKDFTEQQA